MLEKENGIDAVKIIVPDHAYPPLILASLKKNKHVVMHKPLGNRVYETRAVIDAARRKPELTTHMLAWSASHDRYETVKKWIDDGVIGTLREIHNWSYRPVWQQWQSYFTERPEVPKGFDWDLWLGAWPDRPYHPHYTHTVYRGWYDFGAGSIADMGIYSLWPLFNTFGIDKPPCSIETMGTLTRTIGEEDEMKAVPNNVAFPLSSIIRWKFEASGKTGPLDLFWYDGGMKPRLPAEVEAHTTEMAAEGILFVGDEGTIMAGFHGQNPQLFAKGRCEPLPLSELQPPGGDRHGSWFDAVHGGAPSAGNFHNAAAITDAVNLGTVALRAGRKVLFDSEAMKITNAPDANRYLVREYRPGWEM